jgi:hypothetical protein
VLNISVKRADTLGMDTNQNPNLVDLNMVIADLRQQAGHGVSVSCWDAVANYLQVTGGKPDTASYPLRALINQYSADVHAGRGNEDTVKAQRETLQNEGWNQGERLYGSPYAYVTAIPELVETDAEIAFYDLDEGWKPTEADKEIERLKAELAA